MAGTIPYHYGGISVPRIEPTWHYHRILHPAPDKPDTWIRCKQTSCLWQAHNYYQSPMYLVRADERLLKRLQEQDINLERILKASIRLAHAKFQEKGNRK